MKTGMFRLKWKYRELKMIDKKLGENMNSVYPFGDRKDQQRHEYVLMRKHFKYI